MYKILLESTGFCRQCDKNIFVRFLVHSSNWHSCGKCEGKFHRVV